MKQSKEQSIEQSTKKITELTTDQIAEKSTEKIPEQSTEQITEQSEDKTLKPTEPICPSDWHLLNKVCYYFGFENLDFVTASNKCKSKGAILYEAKDQISHDQVFELAKTISRGYQSDNWIYFWIGITDMANENDYRYYSDNSKGNCFKFVNCFFLNLECYTDHSNHLVTWTNWAQNEPGPTVESEDCVQFITKSQYNIPINGRWNDVPCAETNEFICQKELVIETSTGPSIESLKISSTENPTTMVSVETDLVDCSSDWHLISGTCYYFSPENLVFSTAVNRCENMDAILYEPKNQETFDLVFNAAKSITRGRQFDSHNYFWIGINDKARENDFRYQIDNSKGTTSHLSFLLFNIFKYIVTLELAKQDLWGLGAES